MFELVTIVLMLSTIDREPPEDAHLVFEYKAIADERNGFKEFSAAAKMVDDDLIDDVTMVWDRADAEKLCKKHAAALTRWQDGMKKPKLQVPEVDGFDDLLPYLSGWRDMARLGSIQARLHAESGDYKAAMDCAFDVIKFGRLQEAADGPLINYLVAIACKQIGIMRMRQIVHDHQVPKDLLLATNRKLEAMACVSKGYADALRLEYSIAKNFMVEMGDKAGGGQAGLLAGEMRMPKPVAMASPFLFKKNETLALFVDTYTDLVQNSEISFHKRKKMSCKPPRGWELVNSNLIGMILHGMLVPVMDKAVEKMDRSDAELDFLRLQLAIQAFRKDNDGRWPKTLEELVPRWIKALPTDPFARRQASYGYSAEKRMLYSVGHDGIDHGGSSLKSLERLTPFTIKWKDSGDPSLLLDESLVVRALKKPIRRGVDLSQYDENGDGTVSDAELRKAATAVLERMEAKGQNGDLAKFDVDGNGVLSKEERDIAIDFFVLRLKK